MLGHVRSVGLLKEQITGILTTDIWCSWKCVFTGFFFFFFGGGSFYFSDRGFSTRQYSSGFRTACWDYFGGKRVHTHEQRRAFTQRHPSKGKATKHRPPLQASPAAFYIWNRLKKNSFGRWQKQVKKKTQESCLPWSLRGQTDQTRQTEKDGQWKTKKGKRGF